MPLGRIPALSKPPFLVSEQNLAQDQSGINKPVVKPRSKGATFSDLVMKARVKCLTGGLKSNHSLCPPLVEISIGSKPSKPGGGMAMVPVWGTNVTCLSPAIKGFKCWAGRAEDENCAPKISMLLHPGIYFLALRFARAKIPTSGSRIKLTITIGQDGWDGMVS